MNYQVTARKWRPMVFDDVIGQHHVSDTLRNALAQNRLAHAFIFSGTRGCGKTTTARILARAVNCLTPKNFEPCNECEVCREIIDGRSLDVIEIDGASNNGVEKIRELRESVRYLPARGKRKVYIIDEVHMLSTGAFNALLKTLEEPPAHVLFIFATTELHKVPATILSRCQRYDFRRIGITEIVDRLRFIAGQEQITIDDDALLLIAKKGDGSMRDSQSIFDQVISFCGTTVNARQVGDALNIVDQDLFFRVSDVLRANDTAGALDLVKDVINSGFDIKEFVAGLAEHFRNMLIVRSTNSTTLIEESEQHRKRYAADAMAFSLQDILRILKTASDTEASIKYSAQPRFKLEVMMVQLTKMERSVQIDELITRIDDLKKKLQSEGSVALHQPVSTPPAAEPARPRPVIAPRAQEPLPEEPPFPSEPPEAPESYRPVPAAAAEPREVPKERKERTVAAAPRYAVQDIQPKYTFAAPVKPAGEEPKSTAPTAPPIDATLEDVRRGWNAIVDEMRRKKISVGTILGETMPVEVSNGTLQIACGDDFHRGTLYRNKEILAETINSILNSRLRIEPIMSDGGYQTRPEPGHTPAAGASGPAPAPQKAAVPAVSVDDHPLVKKLYSEFGAEKA
ncbi:MAG: DNA polymerase III subunit gamma/tau [Bacteroidetes bacterium]|nr:DNA polymerase III subunit gamma/tau [Bacteroidota bacterium]